MEVTIQNSCYLITEYAALFFGVQCKEIKKHKDLFKKIFKFFTATREIKKDKNYLEIRKRKNKQFNKYYEKLRMNSLKLSAFPLERIKCI